MSSQEIKNINNFADFQLKLSQDFGVPFGANGEEDKCSDFVVEEPWVICPECGEPIYLSDCLHDEKEYWDCPACCFVEEDLI